ncbi:MAG: phosphoribosylglycinamide formyltransferase [Gemmatimonadetes bacterium]|nr:phosphoribosylglycinamide formyltransferase [Gemmatimonadota bacterium]
MSRARIAVLASGGGSNLQALLDHLTALGEARCGEVVVVASNRPDAGALARAARAGIATVVLQSPHAPAGAELAAVLREHAVDLIALAGYMRHVPSEVTRDYHGRMVNVHPALLPSFGGAGMYGPRVHRAVVEARASESGPTVHFVDDVYDHGAVIAQWPVPVLSHDDEHSLASRVLRAEHLLYPRVVDALAGGRIRLGADGRVEGGPLPPRLAPMDPALGDPELAASLDRSLALVHPR